MANNSKRVLDALAEAASAFRDFAQDEMSRPYGSTYEVYYRMKESIALENKARTFQRRHADAIAEAQSNY